ncbi:MAG: ABC transporter permease [Candidatus Bathyarchaeia archaeon]|jgi:ABC-2 type transport system permease protein
MTNDFAYDVWYMFVRANKKYMRSPALVFFSLVTPIIFFFLFTQLFKVLGGVPGFPAGSYLQFAIAGILLMEAFNTALRTGSSIVEDYDSEYLSKLLVTPVSRPAILLGRLLSDGVRVIVQSIIILALAYLMGANFVTGALGIILILITMAVFGMAWSGVSLSVGLATKNGEAISSLSMFLTFPLVFVSTALLPLTFLPSWMQYISNVNPISYIANAVRALTSTGFNLNTILLAYAVMLFIAFLGLGTTMHQFRKLMR